MFNNMSRIIFLKFLRFRKYSDLFFFSHYWWIDMNSSHAHNLLIIRPFRLMVITQNCLLFPLFNNDGLFKVTVCRIGENILRMLSLLSREIQHYGN